MRILPLALALLVFLGACSDSTRPERPSMTGSWSGTSDQVENPVTIWLTVIERDGEFEGWGALRIQGPPLQHFGLRIEGTHVPPNVSFGGRLEGFSDFNYAGTFEAPGIIRGQLRGSGFQGMALTLTRDD